MKFYQALFLIILIGVEAKSKRHGVKHGVGTKDGKTQQRNGSRGIPEEDVHQTGGSRQLSQTASNADHGNIAYKLSKYGHFGLDVGNDPRGRQNDALADRAAGVHTMGVNPVKSIESLEQDISAGSKIKRAPLNETASLVQTGAVQTGVNGIPQSSSYRGSTSGQVGMHVGPSGITNQDSFSQAQYGTTFPRGTQEHYSSHQGNLNGYPWFPPTLGLGGHSGAKFPQAHYQGYYSNGGHPAFPYGPGQVSKIAPPYRLGNIETIPTVGQPAYYYGEPLRHNGQLAAQGDLQGQYTNQVGTNIPAQGGYLRIPLQQGEQGLHTGFDQSPAPGSNTVGQRVSQGGFFSWLKSLFSPDNLRKSEGPFNNPPTQLQVVQNPCPLGYALLPGDGRCLPYCTNGQTTGCAPTPGPNQPYLLNIGLYSGPGRAAATQGFGVGPIHDLGRYVNSGFYYPPPQHINSDPNMWDPAARYYFSMSEPELAKGVLLSPSNPQYTSSGFPVAYARL